MLNKQFGDLGEDIACEYLKKQKLKIIDRNYKNKLGEIDIIAMDKKTYVFIEVKTRSSLDFGYPKEAIGVKKVNTIKNVATNFLKCRGLVDKVSVRFDCVEILFDDNNYVVNHLKNIF